MLDKAIISTANSSISPWRQILEIKYAIKGEEKIRFLVKKIDVFIFFSYAIIFFVGGTFSFNKAVNFRKSDKDFLLELLRKAANNRYLTYC